MFDAVRILNFLGLVKKKKPRLFSNVAFQQFHELDIKKVEMWFRIRFLTISIHKILQEPLEVSAGNLRNQ